MISRVFHPIGMNMSERLRLLKRKLDRHKEGMHGFIVSWDVDSRDASLNARLRRFVFGYDSRKNGKGYHYPGLVEREGVFYLGQSVLFLGAEDFPALEGFLSSNGIVYDVTKAWIGPPLPKWAEMTGSLGKEQ